MVGPGHRRAAAGLLVLLSLACSSSGAFLLSDDVLASSYLHIAPFDGQPYDVYWRTVNATLPLDASTLVLEVYLRGKTVGWFGIGINPDVGGTPMQDLDIILVRPLASASST